MRSAARRCMVLGLSWLHEAQIYRAREPRGAIFGAPAMVSPNRTARSRPPPLACLRREIWTRSCDGHGRNQGPTARYRLRMRQGALSPPERVPASEAAPLPVSPRHGHQPTRRYNHKDFERSLADFEVCPRKRKKEGWYITLASTRAGSTGFTSAAGKPLRSECQ